MIRLDKAIYFPTGLKLYTHPIHKYWTFRLLDIRITSYINSWKQTVTYVDIQCIDSCGIEYTIDSDELWFKSKDYLKFKKKFKL